MADNKETKLEQKQLFSWVSCYQPLETSTSICCSFCMLNICNSIVHFKGANSHGQLCLGHKEDVLLPKNCSESDLPENVVISSITGGGGHTAVITGLMNPLSI